MAEYNIYFQNRHTANKGYSKNYPQVEDPLSLKIWEVCKLAKKLSWLANFCDKYCPVCTRSRKNGSRLKSFVKFYHRICPFCLARERETGKEPYEPR